MKYKVKNITSGEEVLCEKVVVDNQDYFYSKTLCCDTDNDVCIFESSNNIIKTLAGKGYGLVKTIGKYYKVIATTNKDLDLPIVVDEVEELAETYSRNQNGIGYEDEHPNCSNTLGECSVEDFTNGYQRAKETYSFTKEDMVEFAKWYEEENTEKKAEMYFGFSDLDMLDKWQEQRTKTILVK